MLHRCDLVTDKMIIAQARLATINWGVIEGNAAESAWNVHIEKDVLK